MEGTSAIKRGVTGGGATKTAAPSSNATYTDKMSIRHILIIVSGIMVTFGCTALVFSTWSAFQAVVPEQLGVDRATWAFYVTILYLASAFSSPFIGKLLAKMDIRVIFSAAVVIIALAFFLISFAKALWAFYVAGIMMGLGGVVTLWLAIPTLCNSWFNQKSGTIIGVCMAFTGIGGALWLQVFNSFYAGGTDVWTIYFIWGCITLITSLPFTIFCIRTTPQECGQLPYGKPVTSTGKPQGIDASKALKSPVFYVCFLFCGIINLLTMVAQQFPSYTKTLTGVSFDALAVGVMMATVMMVSQAICKMVFGVAADKNSRATFIVSIVSGIAGVLLVWFGTSSEMILYVGAAVYGFFFASCVVLIPIIVRQIFGQREYPQIYSRISLFVNIMGAVGPVFWAFIGGFGYSLVFAIAIVLLVVTFALGWFCFMRAKSVQAQWTE